MSNILKIENQNKVLGLSQININSAQDVEEEDEQEQYYRIEVNGSQIKAARVSNILNYCCNISESKSYQQWVERQGGHKAAKQFTMNAAQRGSKVHRALELYYNNPTEYISYALKKLDTNEKKYLKNYELLLKNYKPIKQEFVITYIKDGKYYGGKLDSLGYVNDKHLYLDKSCEDKFNLEDNFTLCDYKTKEKQPKQISYVLKHFIQLAFYDLGLENMFPDMKKINNYMVFSSSPKQLNIYYANKELIELYKKIALKCLDSFWYKEKFDWKELEKYLGCEWNDAWNRYVYSKDNKFPIRLYLNNQIVENIFDIQQNNKLIDFNKL